jgi:hypothetical protein
VFLNAFESHLLVHSLSDSAVAMWCRGKAAGVVDGSCLSATLDVARPGMSADEVSSCAYHKSCPPGCESRRQNQVLRSMPTAPLRTAQSPPNRTMALNPSGHLDYGPIIPAAVNPPSTQIVCPVMKLDFPPLSRNIAAPASSSGVP